MANAPQVQDHRDAGYVGNEESMQGRLAALANQLTQLTFHLGPVIREGREGNAAHVAGTIEALNQVGQTAAGLRVANDEYRAIAAPDGAVPILTTLPPPGVQQNLPNPREYRIADFDGRDKGYACLDFLRRIMREAQQRDVSHQATIALLQRHVVGEASEVLNLEIQGGETLEDLVRNLETSYAGLVHPTQARTQLRAIMKRPSENYTQFGRRIHYIAFMATRLQPDPEVHKELLSRQTFLETIPAFIRKDLEQREMARRVAGQGNYPYKTLIVQADQINETMLAHEKSSQERKAYSVNMVQFDEAAPAPSCKPIGQEQEATPNATLGALVAAVQQLTVQAAAKPPEPRPEPYRPRPRSRSDSRSRHYRSERPRERSYSGDRRGRSERYYDPPDRDRGYDRGRDRERDRAPSWDRRAEPSRSTSWARYVGTGSQAQNRNPDQARDWRPRGDTPYRGRDDSRNRDPGRSQNQNQNWNRGGTPEPVKRGGARYNVAPDECLMCGLRGHRFDDPNGRRLCPYIGYQMTSGPCPACGKGAHPPQACMSKTGKN